jgi:hypothetical protein
LREQGKTCSLFLFAAISIFTLENKKTFFLHSSNGIIYLGYAGGVFNLRIADILDFILGWNALAVSGDDDFESPRECDLRARSKKHDEDSKHVTRRNGG